MHDQSAHADKLRDGLQMPRLVLTLHNMDNSGECSQEEFCYSGAPKPGIMTLPRSHSRPHPVIVAVHSSDASCGESKI